jgi:DNA-directed RNA polymerase specialized sigma subunit
VVCLSPTIHKFGGEFTHSGLSAESAWYCFMWITNSTVFANRSTKHPSLSLTEERRLIAKAKRGYKAETEELVLRHVGFIIFRIHKKAFPVYVARFGEDILAEAVFVLYDKIKTYNLRYRDKNGNFKPVRFSSYIWKRIDGFILDSLKKELAREKRHVSPEW